MNSIPDYIIDTILTFNNPNDIISFMNTSKYNKNLINDLTSNNNSFIQTQYNLNKPIISKNTWLSLISNENFVLKYINFFKIILKNIRFIDKIYYMNIFSEFRNIYDSLSEEKQLKIVNIFFLLVNNNYHLYHSRSLFEYEFFVFKNHLLYIFDIFLNKNKSFLVNSIIYLEQILDKILIDIKNNPKIYLNDLIQDAVLLNQLYSQSNKFFLNLLYKKIEEHDLSTFFLVFDNEDEEDNNSYIERYSDY